MCNNIWSVILRVGDDDDGSLEAFAVDNSGARFVIFLFADPHLLEGGE